MKLARSTSLHLALATLAPAACVAGSLPVGTIDDPAGSDTDTGAATETSGWTSGIEPPPPADEGNSEVTGDEPAGTGEQPTGGDHLDVECMMTVPDIDATTIVDIGDWPVADPLDIDISASCMVDAVVVDESTVVTTMTCDDAGVDRLLVVTTATPTRPVAWGPGQAIAVHHTYYEHDRGIFKTSLSLHRADDGALVIAAYEGSEGDTTVFDPILAPLTLTLDYEYCAGLTPPPDTLPILMTFENEEGDAISLIEGFSGRLPAGGGDTDEIDIDIPQVLPGRKGESAHTFHFLLQREQHTQ
jgi:hypothetical protein